MDIRCPREECNTKINVAEAVLFNTNVQLKCPSCLRFFKPFDTLSELQKKDILNKKEQSKKAHKASEVSKGKEETQILDDVKNSAPYSGGTILAIGWLIVHDENTHSQTYDLKEGRNLIGKISTSKPCDVMIDTPDPYLSRNHFIITVTKRGNQYQYIIEDYNSTNGTFIQSKQISNTECEIKRLVRGEQIYIEDGCLIQAGKTKIFLKTPQTVANKQQASNVVQQKGITKTIIV